jgi:allophanate hydrolase
VTNTIGWTISQWREQIQREPDSLRGLLQQLRSSIDNRDNAWIHIASVESLDEQLDALNGATDLPLYGVPFAVKDNIDVAGMPTTAACPAFAYIPEHDALSVAKLKASGAIVIGKTNLDQFATGLVGTRSPYGAVPNSFDPAYVSGGSSSGSAVAVAKGLVPFSLGTDTAGSGRVPASFNNIIGLKPTKGRFSTRGVVPACRSLDCVSIFALTLDDAETLAGLLEGFDPEDPYSRPASPARYFVGKPRFGVPASVEWFGDTASEQAWNASLEAMRQKGVELVPIDFGPMFSLAQLLYGGPWVAERYAAVGEFIAEHAEDTHPVVRSIIQQAEHFSAADAFQAEYRRAALVRTIHARMAGVDALLVPTAPRLPTVAQVEADPVVVNSQLGTFTNFVNLADCCALALPAQLRPDGLPFGITLIAPAWQDAALAEFGRRWLNARQLPLGATGRPLPPEAERQSGPPPGYVRLAVVGAHLSGMPLNYQLTERQARLVESTFTADTYKLYALPNTVPPKPGLVRSEEGAEIIVELWDVPLSEFGSFVALVPPPLGIGSLTLHDGRVVKGFICEGSAVNGAKDITHLGGWRAYIQSLHAPA